MEIGSGLHGAMSGNSALVWAKYTKADSIICVDNHEEQANQVIEKLKDYTSVRVEVSDAFEFIDHYSGSIDLLYLDFWVKDNEEKPEGIARAKGYLDLFHKVAVKLSDTSIILIDDTDHIDPWKQTLIVPEARKQGYVVQWIGRQTCMLKTADHNHTTL